MKATTLKQAYFDWLMKEYSYQDIDNNVIEIGTPFLDNDFDYITMWRWLDAEQPQEPWCHVYCTE